MASGGEVGFGSPKICVQVKTQYTPIDRTTLDQLGGVMNNVIKELFDNYKKLSPAIKAEIPLKQIWILSEEE